MNWTHATNITEDRTAGIVSGYISTDTESFPFSAKLGEWAEVEWPDESNHAFGAADHRIAQAYATRHFVTNIKKIREKIAAL